MKVEVKDKSCNEIKFPCLMKSDLGQIVLFYEDGIGTCICSGSGGWNIGYYNEKWNMSAFKKFDGEITLKND